MKHKLMFFSILFVFIFAPGTQHAQAQTKTDSIIKLLKTNPADSTKFSCYDELCWDMIRFNTDSALMYADLALEHAKKSKNPSKIATAYSTLATVYYYKSKISPAIENALKAYEIRKTFPDKTAATKSLNNLAVMYEANGELEKALALYEDAEKNMKADDYIKSCIVNNVGGIYKKQGKYREALDKFLEALKLKEKATKKDPKSEAETLGNIGGIYSALEDIKKSRFYFEKAYNLGMTTDDLFLKAQLTDQMGIICRKEKKFDAAISYYKESLQLKKQYGNPTMISQTLVNIGTLLMSQKKYPEALGYMEEAIKIKRQENDKLGLSIALNDYGIILSKLGKAKEGLLAAQEAITLSDSLHEKDYKLSSYRTMADIYEIMHDDKSALLWLRKTMDLKDTLLNVESRKQITEMETKYQSEKKEQEIVLLNKDKYIQSKELALKNTQRNAFIAGFVLMILLVTLVFRSLQQNKRKNRIITQQKHEVEQAKEIIEHQKELVDEKQKEILDSIHYAKRIQDALLASEDILDKHLGGTENYFVYFRPKDIVSGDFYWATEVNSRQNAVNSDELPTADNKLFYLAVCDSTGHGVPGAFMSLLNIGFLSEAIKEKNIHDPAEIFNYVRGRLIDSISQQGQKDGFDGILLCIDHSSGKFTYASAHNKPVLISDGKLFELPGDKMPVGKGEKTDSFSTLSVKGKTGDYLYLYTDGFADQFGGPKGKKFKYKQLEELLLQNSSLAMNEQKTILDHRLNEWKGNLEQVDDVLVIGIKL